MPYLDNLINSNIVYHLWHSLAKRQTFSHTLPSNVSILHNFLDYRCLMLHLTSFMNLIIFYATAPHRIKTDVDVSCINLLRTVL